MKRIIQSTAILFVLLAVSSMICPDASAQDVRDLDPFTGIGIGVSADVYYTQGNGHQVTIEGKSQDVEDLVTEVSNGFLRVGYDNVRMSRSRLTIHITSKEIESVRISGSAKFMAGEEVNSDEMELAVSGSGGVIFDRLNSDEVETNVSGSGFVELSGGGADEMEARISGSGKILAEDFQVSECSVMISGSGNCTVGVSDELDAKISGSGNVYYRGNPEINSATSGSGSVKSL